ncbi:PTS lactose/cellobiose transporter subunit IIA [Cytobacillus sp. FJAT-54145]|uniref:PTS lactose/cellobiose transporter subunit IIA n=1 Tax=Cytobacillus spartinae TaxID=3299023 RepID=A0ABW6KBE1_9BACI
MMSNQEEVIFQIILHGGNGRSASMEAIAAAKQGKFSEAKEKLTEASEELAQAHHIQTSLIQGEVRGEKSEISLLMIHAQDHLMNAITMKDLATEIVHLHEKIG